MMHLSQNGMNLLKNLEGLRLKAYQCSAGKWTIGYGHTNNVKPTDIITKAEAEIFLSADLVRFENAVNRLVRVKLNQNQFDALVIFCFNIGYGNDGFGGSTMLKLLNSRNYKGVAEQFIRWIKVPEIVDGKIVKDKNGKTVYVDSEGLKNRHLKERALFLKPI